VERPGNEPRAASHELRATRSELVEGSGNGYVGAVVPTARKEDRPKPCFVGADLCVCPKTVVETVSIYDKTS